MTDEEFEEFKRLLQLYCSDVDQHEERKIDVKYEYFIHTWYIYFGREPFPGTEDKQYEAF